MSVYFFIWPWLSILSTDKKMRLPFCSRGSLSATFIIVAVGSFSWLGKCRHLLLLQTRSRITGRLLFLFCHHRCPSRATRSHGTNYHLAILNVVRALNRHDIYRRIFHLVKSNPASPTPSLPYSECCCK